MRKIVFVLVMLLFSNVTLAECSGVYGHQFKTLKGKSFNLCDYQDHVILVVNTASKCGFTPQFEALETIYETYHDKGLLIIGFPSNDFKQELKTDTKIGLPKQDKVHVFSSTVKPESQEIMGRIKPHLAL